MTKFNDKLGNLSKWNINWQMFMPLVKDEFD